MLKIHNRLEPGIAAAAAGTLEGAAMLDFVTLTATAAV